MIITSWNNEFIKRIRKLKDKKERFNQGLFLVEGRNSVSELIKSNFKIKHIILAETFNEILDFPKTDIVYVSDNIFNKLSDTVTPQKVLAVVEIPSYDINQIVKNNGIYLIADNIQDPGNLGTIIRSSDAFNVKCVFTINNCVDIYNPKVVRATMGSIFHIPVFNVSDIDELFRILKNNNIQVVATDLKAENYLHEVDLKSSVVFIMGNEAKGISNIYGKYIDKYIKIPMSGKAESLNVSIATSIFLYESQRQRLINYN
ncbi:MAG: TrmH family RNA methyltransferase [Thermoanaerobacteraceae bacterium]